MGAALSELSGIYNYFVCIHSRSKSSSACRLAKSGHEVRCTLQCTLRIPETRLSLPTTPTHSDSASSSSSEDEHQASKPGDYDGFHPMGGEERLFFGQLSCQWRNRNSF